MTPTHLATHELHLFSFSLSVFNAMKSKNGHIQSSIHTTGYHELLYCATLSSHTGGHRKASASCNFHLPWAKVRITGERERERERRTKKSGKMFTALEHTYTHRHIRLGRPSSSPFTWWWAMGVQKVPGRVRYQKICLLHQHMPS